MANWRIYYGDGSTYDGDPESAPERDVQVIVQIDERTGWFNQTGSDYYIWRADRWWSCDVFGLWDYLASPGWKRVLFGRTLTNEEFMQIFRRIEVEWGDRSGFLRGERRP